jgi:hypothetical protein
MDVHDDVVDRLAEIIAAGGAVCLLGAGFASSGTDQDGKPVPSTQALTTEIKEAVGVDATEDVSLTDIADYCDDRPERALSLRRLMLKRLTLCTPSESQRTIINQPWRAIFTTNFDDLIESCLPDADYQVITPTTRSTDRSSGKLPIYYMHGRAKDLIETSADPRLIISERNYLRLHEDNRELYAQLQNELFAANLMVIIGYSMRDLDVARLFIEAGHAFRAKTVLIANPTSTGIALSRLEKFGSVQPIGVDGLAELLKTASVPASNNMPFQFVEITPAISAAEEILADDFVKLILTGRFDKAKYQRQLIQGANVSEPYCVRRGTALDAIVERPLSGANRFVVGSDLGNGKSVFLEQLGVELMSAGYTVVNISSRLEEAFSELDRLLTAPSPVAFLIDDVIRYRVVAEYIGKQLNNLSLLVCCMRGDPGEVAFQNTINRLGGAVRQVDVNKMSSEELNDWDQALERWGLWEQRIALGHEERIRFLSDQCASENRSIVLSLFRNSQIAKTIDQIITFFLRSGRHERTFAGLLTASLCQQHVTWESLVFWLEIDEQRLRADIQDSELSELFFDGRNWHIITSTQLAEYILRTKFVEGDKDTLVEVFSTIVQRTADSAGDGRLGQIFRENLKELMKFRFLTRLFGDGDDAVTLINRVYVKLSKARYIRNNPQFWLQFAMSRMEVDDLVNAETYLNTALGLAAERGQDYSPWQILDQRARLFLRKNAKEQPLKRAELKQALIDLNGLLDNTDGELIYLYRSAPLILKLLEAKIDDLDAEIRSDVIALLDRIKDAGEGYSKLPRAQKGETKVLRAALRDALLILRFA